MAPKKNVTEEAFNTFKEEVERNSQYLVNKLLQKIESIKDEYRTKIENIEENWSRKFIELEQKYERQEQRQSPTDEPITSDKTIVINKLALLEYSNKVQEQFKNLEVLQQQDEHIQKLKQRIKQRINHNLMMHQNLLFRQAPSEEYQIMVPAIAVRMLVEETHKIYGHCGTYKTYKLLQQNHQFKNMYRTIKQIIKTCDLCQKAKINNITASQGTNVKPADFVH